MSITRARCLRPEAALAAGIILCWLSIANAAELNKATLEAFERYVKLTEAHMGPKSPDKPFLWVDGLPYVRRQDVYDELKQGQIAVESLKTTDRGEPVKVPDGLIHHWIGIVFIPGTTLKQVLKLVQDYDNHQNIYKPDVSRSKLLRREGNLFHIFLRFHKKKVVTVVLNTEHDVRYFPVDRTHEYATSYSTRIAEVESPGTPAEREKTVGNDTGFMWRLVSYWRYEERDGGVYVECESITLTRNVPSGLGWIIGPYIKGVPKESIVSTLDSTRQALAGSLH